MFSQLVCTRAQHYYYMNKTPNTLITITSSKYMISYPINMKVSNQVFNTSNSNVLESLVPGRVIMKLVFSVPSVQLVARARTLDTGTHINMKD